MRRPSLLFLAFLSSAALHAEPVSLFDGKTLNGWDFDPAMWRVEDGVITGGSTTEKIKKNDFISTKKSYQNFELKLKIKVSGDPKTGMLNSGIQIRSVREGSAMSGYQVDCGAGWFGKIYDEHRRNKVIWAPTPEQQASLDKAIDVFGWNEYRIRAEGARIQTWINGVHCMDYTETDPNIALDGHIAPQVHSGGVCLVQVKEVTIEELPATPGAPTWQSIGGIEGMKAKLPPKPQADAAKPKRDISYNNVQGTSKSAEEQQKLFHLPEGYEIELVVQESEGLGKFVSVYFDQRGRMWTQTALEYPVDSNENPAAAEAVYAAHGKDKVVVYPRESVNGPIPAGGLTNPTVFADGLAIPLGILPWGNGDTCYVQHGHDLKLYKDTNGDGKADTFDVVLTGFGVQDSHLFPHQFTRAPGGWIWMAQGLFNNSKVHKPGSDVVVDWPKCSMARMRPDGSEFEVISTGPNNIWGLVITATVAGSSLWYRAVGGPGHPAADQSRAVRRDRRDRDRPRLVRDHPLRRDRRRRCAVHGALDRTCPAADPRPARRGRDGGHRERRPGSRPRHRHQCRDRVRGRPRDADRCPTGFGMAPATRLIAPTPPTDRADHRRHCAVLRGRAVGDRARRYRPHGFRLRPVDVARRGAAGPTRPPRRPSPSGSRRTCGCSRPPRPGPTRRRGLARRRDRGARRARARLGRRQHGGRRAAQRRRTVRPRTVARALLASRTLLSIGPITSATLRASNDGVQTSTFGNSARTARGVKAVSGSYGSLAKSDGLTENEDASNNNWLPSGVARATWPAAICPLAPGLFSTTTLCPSAWAMCGAISRAIRSAPPPAG